MLGIIPLLIIHCLKVSFLEANTRTDESLGRSSDCPCCSGTGAGVLVSIVSQCEAKLRLMDGWVHNVQMQCSGDNTVTATHSPTPHRAWLGPQYGARLSQHPLLIGEPTTYIGTKLLNPPLGFVLRYSIAC